MANILLQLPLRRIQANLRQLQWRNLVTPCIVNSWATNSYYDSKTDNSLLLRPVQRRCYHEKATSSNQDTGSWKDVLSFGFGGLGMFLVGCALYITSDDLRGTAKRARETIFGAVPNARCVGIDHEGAGGSRRSKQYNFLAEAVEVAAPAVVFIEKSESVPTIFGVSTAVSSGSGFIVSEDGYVLMNAHVVGKSNRVRVKLVTGRVVTGEVTDTDHVADLALVKLDIPIDEKLPALEFGNLADVRPGEWVVALGSPLSLENTITAGIVSSVHRPSEELGIHRSKPDMTYIQTDAPITIGNSGGPLVNLDGEVVGVNTMTAGPGISFAIPADIARDFVKNASKAVNRRVSAAKYVIGISMLSLTSNIIRLLQQRSHLPKNVTHGVFLANVWPNGAAAQAGLQQGDVIVRINGKDIHNSREPYEIVQSGKRMTMEVVRGSQWMTVTVIPELVN